MLIRFDANYKTLKLGKIFNLYGDFYNVRLGTIACMEQIILGTTNKIEFKVRRITSF